MRHRSIRLRVGILIAIPILCLLLLYAFTASLTVGNALTQIRSRSLRGDFVNQLTAFQKQAASECGYALVSLAAPTNPQFAGQLGIEEAATTKALSQLEDAFRSPAVTANATPAELAAIHAMEGEAAELNLTRRAVADNAITKLAALANYDAVIESGNRVLVSIIGTQAGAALATQDMGVLNLDRAAQTAGAETDLLSADLLQGSFPDGDRMAIASFANNRQQLIDDWLPSLSSNYRSGFKQYLTAPVSAAMLTAESTVANTPWRIGVPPGPVIQARTTFQSYAVAMGKALTAAGAQLQQTLNQQARTAEIEGGFAIGFGLLAIIGSIIVSGFIGRGLVRQLRDLRASALSLANDELPRMMSQVRAGEPVDVGEPQSAVAESGNEIEQVRDAFGVVQHAAVQSALDEARLRRGISDVFRNLAGRSQSLLHRQLTLLDAMERRASEPEQLEDLFRIDHLTTRMRRHAEGLVILSGDTPARGWRQPVPLIDVLRAAVAEVEDYTRIRVLCRTGASVAGHAVADVIHLLAELAENATVFSPPNTPVRMQGDMVGRGFAIEIEDRGLGISAARLEEINANLVNPPQFDLSGSDRLGLFIAGQLAQRHDIKVTLRPSVYGGTTAIVLLPLALVVEEPAIGRGGSPALPSGRDDGSRYERGGGRHAALTAGNGHAPSADNGVPSPTGTPERSLSGSGFSFGRLSHQDTGGSDPFSASGVGQPPPYAAPTGYDQPPPYAAPTVPGYDQPPPYAAPTLPGYDQPPPYAAPTVPGYDQRLRFPAPTGSGPDQPSPFATPVDDGEGQDNRPTTAEIADLGLPVRVRQANLAPQLRDAPQPAQSAVSGGFSLPGRRPPVAEPPPTPPDDTGRLDRMVPPASPEAARDMVSALQRGWQLGRAAAPASPEPDATAQWPKPDEADEAEQGSGD